MFAATHCALLVVFATFVFLLLSCCDGDFVACFSPEELAEAILPCDSLLFAFATFVADNSALCDFSLLFEVFATCAEDTLVEGVGALVRSPADSIATGFIGFVGGAWFARVVARISGLLLSVVMPSNFVAYFSTKCFTKATPALSR